MRPSECPWPRKKKGCCTKASRVEQDVFFIAHWTAELYINEGAGVRLEMNTRSRATA